jgi:alpha-ribazole phosphatase
MSGSQRLIVWRHPKARGAEGRCIGRTDLAVDPRRAKRLAHRVRAFARRAALPRVVHTSPLARAADVGRWLRRWGWTHVVDARLSELDFGAWDGRRWDDVPRAAIDAWAADLAHAAPGGGESQQALCERVRSFVDEVVRPAAAPVLAVSHGGWIVAWRAGARPQSDAATWPAPPRHARRG